MNRRAFVGWLGGMVGTVCIYRELPDGPLYAQDDANDQRVSKSFVFRNVTEIDQYVTQLYTDTRIADRSVPEQARYHRLQTRQLKIRLKPGEEFSITIEK